MHKNVTIYSISNKEIIVSKHARFSAHNFIVIIFLCSLLSIWKVANMTKNVSFKFYLIWLI